MAVSQMVNLLRGSVKLEVVGAFPERFLNLCAQRGVAFWGVEQPDSRTLRLTVAWTDRKGLEELAERTGCTIRQRGKKGMPPFLLGFKKRYAFLTGLALALAAVCVLSRFVLVIEVEGNESVPSQIILSELRRQGLRPGVYGPSLPVREMTNEALIRLEDLSWMTINLHGIRAQVVVRERIKKPELLDKKTLGDIVAKAPGLVERMEVWSGDPAVAKGSIVMPGETLIRGSVQIDPPQYSELPIEWMAVRAMGKVEGRTWRTIEASIPLTAAVKTYDGEKTTRWWLSILGRRVNFFQNSGISYGRYDKISNVWELTLPGVGALPAALGRETLRSYETQSVTIDAVAAQAMLEVQLLQRLHALLGESGEELSHSFSAQERDGLLTVTLTAECREELGRFVPAS